MEIETTDRIFKVDKRCICPCDCNRKLLVESSIKIGKCTGCRIGNCFGKGLLAFKEDAAIQELKDWQLDTELSGKIRSGQYESKD